ncbi:PRC domain protein [Natrialba magadii ATCC 43099]|uniref:PRC domain protein n=3 Tax=Natrialba TaxID=63742 RepID=D3SZ78_NATMM|nr:MULTISPECIES: PRC-barrel domain-containing protein [Natrialba]ADD06270.1 PRC domain protein [Natrialba magadii ATCC 43099]ELY31296.1 PRC-barrel domain-containing protein [Natrialba magadii ATCC 43099]ELY89068.1 PRC-barrel domain-containing protein [Natrialba hulunbeirensis JCM 10989]ELY93584.1 PRC-barrel domain-containing protein [Natrialba chahannaoensis JCM 10990]OIB57455.1 photosystem reaction center subunit H [Natrialba sp. SSL1]
MSEILAENLSGKSVMGSDGTELGLLYNITMDLKSGQLHDLVIEPDDELPERAVDFNVDDAGRFLVSVSRVQAVKDYIVVQR